MNKKKTIGMALSITNYTDNNNIKFKKYCSLILIFNSCITFQLIINFKSVFLFYLRGKSSRRDGGHVLGAQVLRGVGKL